MKKRHGFIAAAVAVSLLAAQTFAGAYYTQDLTFPLQSSDNETVTGDYYVKSTLDNISWGFLPNRDSEPLMINKIYRLPCQTPVEFRQSILCSYVLTDCMYCR